MTVTAPQQQPAPRPDLRAVAVRRGRLVPLAALAGVTAMVGFGLWRLVDLSSATTSSVPVHVTGLSLALAIVQLLAVPALLAVAARPAAWPHHFLAGAIIGLGTWLALGGMSPSLLLAGAVGAAVALPARYPGNRVVRLLVIPVPGVFAWLQAGTGLFDGLSPVDLGFVVAAPLVLVIFDIVTWDLPRAIMRSAGSHRVPVAMDRIEATRLDRQIDWRMWSALALVSGMLLVGLWWAGGRAPHRPTGSMVPLQVQPTDTWLDVNGAYRVDWSRESADRADAHTERVFAAGNRTSEMRITNTGNPLLAGMYFEASEGVRSTIESVSLNALGTPTVIRSEVVSEERIDCVGSNRNGDCRRFTYTALVEQYIIEVAIERPRNLKVADLAPLVDQLLDQVHRRLAE